MAKTTPDNEANAKSIPIMPKTISNAGAIVLGVGGDNSNNSYGTFYEGAIVSGYPSDATDLAVFQNVKAAGYGR